MSTILKPVENAAPTEPTSSNKKSSSDQLVGEEEENISAKVNFLTSLKERWELWRMEREERIGPQREFEQILRRSKPVANRGVYAAILAHDWKRFLEIGVRDGSRTKQILKLAASRSPKETLVYTGVDLFEAAGETNPPHLSLKEAQQELTPLAGKARFLPGDPLSALKPQLKTLGSFDVIILSSGLDLEVIRKCWDLFMQLMHDNSVLLVEPAATVRRPRYRKLTSEDVLEIADKATN